MCIKNNFVGWNEFIYTCQDVSIKNRIIDEVIKIYAMECLKLAADNAEADHHPIHINWIPIVIKGSIRNENNLIK